VIVTVVPDPPADSRQPVLFPDSTLAEKVTLDETTNVPPSVPPVAAVVILEHVKPTFMLILVLPFATRMSDGSSEAHVNHDPEPFAALFHWFTESMLTDEF
jgi:hypothetical protein